MSRFNNRNIVTEQELESFLAVGSSLALTDHSEAALNFGNLEYSEFTDVILVSFTRSACHGQAHNNLYYSLLRQKDTWNRIQITLRGFQALMRSFKVFHEFWTFVRGFGLKFEPEDEYFIGYKGLFQRSVQSSSL